jgi:aminopeptidase N
MCHMYIMFLTSAFRAARSCYSLFLGFARSPVNFHAADGSGYKFMGDAVLKVCVQPTSCTCLPRQLTSLIGFCCAGDMSCCNQAYHEALPGTSQVDKINPQVAARMTSAFTQWRKFSAERQEQMKSQLQRIVDANSNGTGLSENVYEIASKSLE